MFTNTINSGANPKAHQKHSQEILSGVYTKEKYLWCKKKTGKGIYLRWAFFWELKIIVNQIYRKTSLIM